MTAWSGTEKGQQAGTAGVGNGRASDELDLWLVRRVGRWSLILWIASIGGACLIGLKAAAGIALGGGIVLSFLQLHLALARLWMSSARGGRSARVYLWAIWLAKWTLVGLLLWWAMWAAWASPVWLCVGAALVPFAATLFALSRLPGLWPRRAIQELR